VGLLNVPSAAIVKKVAVFARVPEMSSFVIRKVVAVAVVFPAPAKAAGTEAIANRIGQIDLKNIPINFVIDFLAICLNRESRSGSQRTHYTPARWIRTGTSAPSAI
jgi:energy-converting hydrogenase Eha subunit A